MCYDTKFKYVAMYSYFYSSSYSLTKYKAQCSPNEPLVSTLSLFAHKVFSAH